MKTMILSLLMALLTAVSAPVASAANNVLSDPAAHAGEVSGTPDRDPYLGRTDGYRPTTWNTGDSITYLNEPTLRARSVGWEITAVPGRNVCTLPYYVTERLTNPTPVRVAVIALGTNACPGWTEANYRDQVNRFPASTKVVLVTTYRDPALWPSALDYRRRAVIQAHYSEWMRHIATERPHTCVADWRAYILSLNTETRHKVLRDGVHPWGIGLDRRATLLINTIKGCP